MRLVAGTAAIARAIAGLQSTPPSGSALLDVLAIAAGIALFPGVWTPLAGVLLAALEFWNAFFQPSDPWAAILLGSMGAALALVGPGAWSLDARIFGWKRIRVQDPRR